MGFLGESKGLLFLEKTEKQHFFERRVPPLRFRRFERGPVF
jgi:hypothetical protein